MPYLVVADYMSYLCMYVRIAGSVGPQNKPRMDNTGYAFETVIPSDSVYLRLSVGEKRDVIALKSHVSAVAAYYCGTRSLDNPSTSSILTT